MIEQLLSTLEDWCSAYGIAGLSVMVVCGVAFLVQLHYWVLRYGRIPTYRGSSAAAAEPSVSVAIICRGNDSDFLERRLPAMLEQEYNAFEIIVADITGDADFADALARIADHTPRLRVVHLVRDRRFPISDKQAFNMAIKAAACDNILLTTPDTMPDSPQWLARMSRGFATGDIVLGYCGMEGDSLADKLIRIDNVGLTTRWLSAAVNRHPYRGTIQNIGFSKKLYFDNAGFNYLNMNIGIEDLFIQKLLPQTTVSIVVTPNSIVRQKIWGGLRWWYTLRRTNSFCFKNYPRPVKRSISTELISRAIFFAVSAVLLTLAPVEIKIWTGAVVSVRFGMVMFELHRITKRLGEKGLWAAAIVYDLLAPFYEACMSIDRRFRHTPNLWR